MKKLQMLTLAMLLSSVQMMAADALKLKETTNSEGIKTPKANTIKIAIVNKSNMQIKASFYVYKSGTNGSAYRGSSVIPVGQSSSLTGFEEGDQVRELTITYYNADGTAGDKDTQRIVISGETLLSGPANNVQNSIAKAIYVYGDSAALAGALSTVPATATTPAVSLPSRFIAYWMDSAKAASETAGSLQPVTMYGLSIDGKFTTTTF